MPALCDVQTGCMHGSSAAAGPPHATHCMKVHFAGTQRSLDVRLEGLGQGADVSLDAEGKVAQLRRVTGNSGATPAHTESALSRISTDSVYGL